MGDATNKRWLHWLGSGWLGPVRLPDAIGLRLLNSAYQLGNHLAPWPCWLLLGFLLGTIPAAVDFIAISSYGPNSKASGVVRIVKDLEEEIAGRHLLVVEDIVDTGLTLGYLLRILRERSPASLKVCTLLDRSVRRIVDHPIAYRGFEVPDRFVVGYGLDYQQRYRNLPFIALLNPAG